MNVWKNIFVGWADLALISWGFGQVQLLQDCWK